MVATPHSISRSVIKTALLTTVSVFMLGATVGCTVTSGYDNQPVYRDGNSNRANGQLRRELNRNGYKVLDIRRDNYRGRQVLVAYAEKNNQFYDFIYSYPDLKRLSTIKKNRSNSWQNDKDYKDKYNNNRYKDTKKNKGKKYNRKNDGKVQQDARYSVIKQRAIRKVRAMGYSVTDIDFDSKKNRGIFEIEARRGGQDYEIELSYPNLDVIKLKKD